MKTKSDVYGVEKLNGHEVWALFEACALGDVAKVKALLLILIFILILIWTVATTSR